MSEYLSTKKVNRLLDPKDRTLSTSQKKKLVQEMKEKKVQVHRYKPDPTKSRIWNQKQKEQFQKKMDR